MPASDDPLRNKVVQWVQLADDDLLVAEQILVLTTRRPYRVAAYHAQQCAEKYLKAFLVARRVDFPFTHNLSTLLELAASQEPLLLALEDIEILTAFATSARYPADEDPVTESEACEAIDLARKARSVVVELLRCDGFSQ
jgi:HEPN domain-containing protein